MISQLLFLWCTTLVVFHQYVYGFTPNSRSKIEVINTPKWKHNKHGTHQIDGSNNQIKLPLLAKSSANDYLPGSTDQYVEDGIAYKRFSPLHDGVSPPSAHDPALGEAVKYFKEVDCSGESSSGVSYKDITTIPYDEMQLAFFQGDDVIDVVLQNAKDSINIACENIFQYHKSRSFAGITNESDRNAASAIRSIRCLVYYIGGRILNSAKRAMSRLERHEDGKTSEIETARRSIEGRIRRMVLDLLRHWEELVNPKQFDPFIKKYPALNNVKSPEEYVAKVWDYLNTNAFGSELPEFVDMRFSWYDIFNADNTVIDNGTQEMFRLTNKDDVAFPCIAYPKDFIGYGGALGNCIFRSMLKLYCDMYGPRFMGEDFASSAIEAMKFIESDAASHDNVGFSCIQQDVIGIDPDLSSILPNLNAVKPLRNADFDINDTTDVFPEVHQVSYFKNRICLGDLLFAVKDRKTALELFDISFRLRSIESLSIIDEQIKRSNIDVTAGLVVNPNAANISEDIDSTDAVAVSNTSNTNETKAVNSSTKLDIQGPKDRMKIDSAYYAWSRDKEGHLTIPIKDIQRSLLNADLDKFGNLLSLGMNELLSLKPLQLNTIQNRIVSLCVDTLNCIRGFDAYAVNFSLTPDDLIKQKTTGLVAKSNTTIIQCILFLYKLIGRCLSHNGFHPLDNTFLRKRPLELLIREINPVGLKEEASMDPTSFGAASVKEESKMQPVPFPVEYLNENVAPDDSAAIQFLVNYYNFNLFGGRLPIDLKVIFNPEAGDDYLSSHVDCPNTMSVPVIMLNPLVIKSKPLVARLILEECFHLFIRTCCSYKTDFGGKGQALLTDVIESDIPRRTRQHIANCIETSGDWPFFFDDLHDMALWEQTGLKGKKFNIPLRTTSLNTIYRSLLEHEKNIINTMEQLILRTKIADLWEHQILPIRHFINAVQSGDYDLVYTIINNPSSVGALSHLRINDINIIENKFKDALTISQRLDDERGQVLSSDRKQMNALVNVEFFKVVECAFDELREQATKHGLISASDLTEGITEATNNLARCQPEEAAQQQCNLDYTIIGVNNCGLPAELRRNNKDDEIVNQYMDSGNIGDDKKEVEATPAAEAPPSETQKDVSKEPVDSDTVVHACSVDIHKDKYTLNREERSLFTEAVYRVYNRSLFNDSLPSNVRIEFVDEVNDLSVLVECMHTTSPPTIKINNMLWNAKLLFLQMMVQMVNLSFSTTTHNVEMDCLKIFGLPYKSSFQRFHAKQQQLIKSRLLPLSREARLKAKSSGKGDANDKFINSLKKASDVRPAGGSGNSLLDMEIDEFVDEILEGRSKIHLPSKDAKLCNPFEEYQALKSFAKHFVNWKITKNDYQEASKVDPTGTSAIGERILQMAHNALFRTVWCKHKFDQIEKGLKKMGMDMPLSVPLTLNWQVMLNEDQQYLMMKYLSLNAKESDTVFTMLVNSGACSREDACSLLVKLTDPHLKLEPYPSESEDHSLESTTESVPVNRHDASERAMEGQINDASFAQQLETLTKSLEPDIAETVHLLVDKLVHRNYSDAMGILSCNPKRHYLKETVIKYLDVIRENGVIKERHYIEILEFLRN
ncbi:hypothetical protein BBOV_III011070 [Babesia bovis T2Bo]|uniref:Uncharacterized protein n=1 Tax=Babesia bovis TaxID=5865 RepID=A7AQ25_BABBO|nr:hypothetical protein BBOV_III011070 [Babesia bovis T2Bo]EDO08659.1 hypothetical protein BBOV_III011070 [Babesia bovis T2Bo]|eukprot:XP_001612227.1 hypothetical protein [Babesia bovis T2Bo]